jgi:hypothetical protein
VRPLTERLSKHKSQLKSHKKGNAGRLTSFKILKYPDAYIELLERCPCDTIEELQQKEGEWIRNSDCVNRKVAGRTRTEYLDEKKEYFQQKSKEYYEANKEAKKAYARKYGQENKEKIAIKGKKYREKHKAEKSAKDKAYREKPEIKARLKANNSKQIHCECGITYCHAATARHKRTERHQNYERGIIHTPKNSNDIISCECGLTYTRVNRKRHMVSKAHKAMLNETYTCHECEINFPSDRQRIKHEATDEHKETYDKMFEDVFLSD